MYRPAVAAQRPRAFGPGEGFASTVGRRRRVHHAQHRHRSVHQPHRDRRTANALEKIAGGIVRVHDPGPAVDGAVAYARRFAGLFADEDAGQRALQRRAQAQLDFLVDGRLRTRTAGPAGQKELGQQPRALKLHRGDYRGEHFSQRRKLVRAHATFRGRSAKPAPALRTASKAMRKAAAFQDWPRMPRGAKVRPCSHSLNAQPSSALAPASFASSARAPVACARQCQRSDPESAYQRPDAAVVILPVEVLQVPRHVGPPQLVVAGWVAYHAHRPGIGDAPRVECASVRRARLLVGESASSASTLPKTSPSSPKKEKLTKDEIEVAVLRLALHVVLQQPRAPVFGQRGAERMEQLVEIRPRLLGALEAVELFDAVPQRVGVEHEARARHDVGPVARLVLLQQEEALVLLRLQPLDGLAMPGRASAARRRPGRGCRDKSSAISHHSVASMQPKYQKSASRRAGRRISESGRSAPDVRQRHQAGRGFALEHASPDSAMPIAHTRRRARISPHSRATRRAPPASPRVRPAA